MAYSIQRRAYSKGNHHAKYTFGAYNAVTGYFQNVRRFKDHESKFKSIMYGTGLQRTQSAFDLCDEFARKGSTVLN